MHPTIAQSPWELISLSEAEKRELVRCLTETFAVSAAISWDETDLHASAPRDEAWNEREAGFTVHYSEWVELEEWTDSGTLLRQMEGLRGRQQIVRFRRLPLQATIVTVQPAIVPPATESGRRAVIATMSLRYRVERVERS